MIAPKNLLRHKDCKSNLSEFDDLEGHPGFDKQGTCFKRLIKDQNNHKEVEEGVNRLILCSGKASYVILHLILKKFEFAYEFWLYHVIPVQVFLFTFFFRSTMSLMTKERSQTARM